MTIVDKYLKEFVLNNRRVIIPDLGAFLLKENANGEKSIVFSSFLRYNDGFLEEALMLNAQVNKTQASSAIKKFVNEATRAIRNRRRYEIEDFGYFTHDDKGAVQFIPSLETIQILNPPIVQIKEETESPVINKNQVTEAEQTANNNIAEVPEIVEPVNTTIVEQTNVTETVIAAPDVKTIENIDENTGVTQINDEAGVPQNTEPTIEPTAIKEPIETVEQTPIEQTIDNTVSKEEVTTHTVEEATNTPVEQQIATKAEEATKPVVEPQIAPKAEKFSEPATESQIPKVEQALNQTQQQTVTNTVNREYAQTNTTARQETTATNDVNGHLALLYQTETKKRTRLLWVIIVLLIVIVAQLVLLYLCITDSDYCFLRGKTAIDTSTEQTLVVSKEGATLISPDSSKMRVVPSASINTSEMYYHVIAGCFSEKINAERFLQKSVSEGYESAELLPKFGDLYPVSINKSRNSNEAENLRDIYNARHDAEAWIHHTY